MPKGPKGEKRPADVIGNAIRVAKIATGEEPEDLTDATMPSRLEKLVHYVVAVVPPDQLGATKLAKILWFADLEHYRLNGTTLTRSDDYRKKDQGPLHVDFNDAIGRLKKAQAIAERAAITPVGTRREFVWITQPDMSEFNGQELVTLHSVIEQIKPMSAKQVSNLTHGEPWKSAYDGERLPVAAAAVQFGDVSDDDMEWAESEFHAVRETA